LDKEANIIRKSNLKRQNSSRMTQRIHNYNLQKEKPPLSRVYSYESIACPNSKFIDDKFSVKKRDKDGNLIEKNNDKMINDATGEVFNYQNNKINKKNQRCKSTEIKNYPYFNKNSATQSIVKN